jgi:hypothetical protein
VYGSALATSLIRPIASGRVHNCAINRDVIETPLAVAAAPEKLSWARSRKWSIFGVPG